MEEYYEDFIISYNTIPHDTITFNDLFIPHMGSSTIMSAISKTSFAIPVVSLPTTIDRGNLYSTSSNGLLRLSCSTATICTPCSFNFLTTSTVLSAYSQFTQPVVLIDAFFILEFGGVNVAPQRMTFSAATASANRKIEPTLYVSNTLSKMIVIGFFLINL